MKRRFRLVPHFLTEEQAKDLAEQIVFELRRLNEIQDFQIAQYIGDLAYFGPKRKDGYDLARQLEIYRFWAPTSQMVAVLETFFVKADRLRPTELGAKPRPKAKV